MSHRTRTRWWAIGVGMLLAASASQPASAGGPRTRWVDDDGHAGVKGCGAAASAFRRIQPAIDVSGTGDTIVVCPGRYRQNLGVSGDTRDELTLRGTALGAVFIRAPQAGGVSPLLRIDRADGIRIRNLVFEAPTAAPCRRVSALLRIEGAQGVRVVRSRFEPVGANTIGPCGYVDAIDVLDEATAFIDEVTIRDFRETGVYADGVGTGVVVEDSRVTFLHAAEAPAAFTIDSTGLFGDRFVSATFRRNTVRSGMGAARSTPIMGSGIIGTVVSDAVVAGNNVGYVVWGISLGSADAGSFHHNVVKHGRRFNDEPPVGVWFDSGEFANVYRNTVKGYAAGILVTGGAANLSIHDNDFRGNHPHDCRDTTTGAGTAGTANFWTSNLGVGASPTGICSPP